MQLPTSARTTVDVARLRGRFPALDSETVFLENAGGSQVPAVVADAIHEYMRRTYVQLGAGYALADQCDAIVHEAHEFINLFMNGRERGQVILGPSCTQLCTMLAGGYADALEPGDEIIVVESGHEANVGPWMKLADRGFTVKMWAFDKASMTCPVEELEKLLTERTKIIAFVHVSNLLGEIVDVEAITRIAHATGARVVVDGVAYAPHRAIDVAAWDVDWYVYSNYKVYGPHMAALFGTHEALAELTGPNHFFIPREEIPYKFELGGASHEGCAGLLALGEYLNFLAGREEDVPIDRQAIVDAFDVMHACEDPVQKRLIGYLLGKDRVRIIGPAHSGPDRVGTISFVHESKSSAEIAAAAHAQNIGIRNGHMYAYRLCEALGLDPADGVVRVSLVHYNTVEEIDRLIEVFERVL
ncbi:MAG: cysteine desulfurase-like protein [Planctomycetota bacterium]|nr:cysteine desulfurase-like protein [Planctomycetota bacterium]